jgi:hypothetical protein
MATIKLPTLKESRSGLQLRKDANIERETIVLAPFRAASPRVFSSDRCPQRNFSAGRQEKIFAPPPSSVQDRIRRLNMSRRPTFARYFRFGGRPVKVERHIRAKEYFFCEA